MQIAIVTIGLADITAAELALSGHDVTIFRVPTQGSVNTVQGFLEVPTILIDDTVPDALAARVIDAVRIGPNPDAVVMVLRAAGTPGRACVALLDAGADDVSPADAGAEEINAVLTATMRRVIRPSRPAMTVGGITFHYDGHPCEVGSRPLSLTSKEFAILAALFETPGRVISKRSILARLYPSGIGCSGREIANTKIVEVFICNIRRKLVKAGGNPAVVMTVANQGYTVVEPTAVLANA